MLWLIDWYIFEVLCKREQHSIYSPQWKLAQIRFLIHHQNVNSAYIKKKTSGKTITLRENLLLSWSSVRVNQLLSKYNQDDKTPRPHRDVYIFVNAQHS